MKYFVQLKIKLYVNRMFNHIIDINKNCINKCHIKQIIENILTHNKFNIKKNIHRVEKINCCLFSLIDVYNKK